MNVEEAVEIILRAQPYEDCPTCTVAATHAYCDLCRGSGQRINDTYRTACEVLRRPLPKRPSNIFYDIKEDMAKNMRQLEDEHLLKVLEDANK